VPRLVEIEVGVDMISAGDSHSVAVNSESALVYFWGVYKNTNGNMQKPFDKPTRVGESIFNKPVLKLLSGYNHTMILMDKRVKRFSNLFRRFIAGAIRTPKC
jgi:alpha-tubulin suppressor-like RCC1 family protein